MAELKVEAAVNQLSTVICFLEEQLESMGASMKAVLQLSIALEEMFMNVASYAYADRTGTGDALIRVECAEENGQRFAVVTLIDRGIPFDPLAKEDPDITLSAEERQIGGLGIFMVKKSMNEVSYSYEDGQNIFIMKKVI